MIDLYSECPSVLYVTLATTPFPTGRHLLNMMLTCPTSQTSPLLWLLICFGSMLNHCLVVKFVGFALIALMIRLLEGVLLEAWDCARVYCSLLVGTDWIS